MSNLLSPQDFGLKIYNRFPLKYRGDDAQNNFALKRYLQSAGDGGFKYAIEDINGLTSLVDPNSVKAEFLPVIFQQYGFEPFNGIPEEYLRYLLPKLGDIYSMKGSLQAVEYLCTSLSGIKTITSVTYDSKGDPYIEVRLEMDVSLGDFVPDISSLNSFSPQARSASESRRSNLVVVRRVEAKLRRCIRREKDQRKFIDNTERLQRGKF